MFFVNVVWTSVFFKIYFMFHKRKTHSFETTWGWVNDDRMIFGTDGLFCWFDYYMFYAKVILSCLFSARRQTHASVPCTPHSGEHSEPLSVLQGHHPDGGKLQFRHLERRGHGEVTAQAQRTKASVLLWGPHFNNLSSWSKMHGAIVHPRIHFC